MASILVLYYSRGGNTERMAQLVAEGVTSQGGEAEVKGIAEAKPSEMLTADGVIIGSPTYYGQAAAPVQKFFDDSVKHHGRLAGKVGAAFSSSANIGGGNETAILSILLPMLIHGMIIQGNPLGDHYGPVSIGEPDARVEKQCRELGQRTARLVTQLA